MRTTHLVAIAALALAAAGCGTAPNAPNEAAGNSKPLPGAVLKSIQIGPDVEQRILALNPEHISEEDVRDTLSKAPAPRVYGIHGGVYPVELLMRSFGRFLTGMGYPEKRIRDAGDNSWSYSPYGSGAEQAGEIAWYYEHEGMRPLLVGHSQGGIQVVKILHELAGSFGDNPQVFNPLTRQFENRTTIVDPLTGEERPVIGLSVAYASVVGTGGWSLALPVHWAVASRIRTIPDTVDDFTGYRIGIDFFAMDAPGFENLKTFHANGKANVRNVTLPAEYSHVFVPATADLAKDPAMKTWINAFDPNDEAHRAPLPNPNASNVLWAADVWYGIKKHWCIELQRLIQAQRASAAQSHAPRSMAAPSGPDIAVRRPGIG